LDPDLADAAIVGATEPARAEPTSRRQAETRKDGGPLE
jgi:hypothetical protein